MHFETRGYEITVHINLQKIDRLTIKQESDTRRRHRIGSLIKDTFAGASAAEGMRLRPWYVDRQPFVAYLDEHLNDHYTANTIKNSSG